MKKGQGISVLDTYHLLTYPSIIPLRGEDYCAVELSGMEDYMTYRGFSLVMIVFLAGSGIALAQSNSGAEQLYSAGVHAFNSQRYAEAVGWFDQLEAKGAQDPRVFFFRGLAHNRLGDAVAANTDYETAAKLELTVTGRSFSVPTALERIQGRERTTIEQHRRAAKRNWETEENLRRQDEFLTQKAENQKFYQTIIKSGESAISPAPTATVHGIPLPFGVQPVAPFGVDKVTSQSKIVTGVTSGGLSDNNKFKADVERVTIIEEPSQPSSKTRQQDPSEKGVFDSFNADDDEQGFDASALLLGGNPANSRPGSGLDLSNIFSNFGSHNNDFESNDDVFLETPGDFKQSESGGNPLSDNDLDAGNSGMTMSGEGFHFGLENMKFTVTVAADSDSTKDKGRSFGKGFTSLFKKSGNSDIPSAQSAVTPSIPAPIPDDSK